MRYQQHQLAQLEPSIFAGMARTGISVYAVPAPGGTDATVYFFSVWPEQIFLSVLDVIFMPQRWYLPGLSPKPASGIPGLWPYVLLVTYATADPYQ